LMAWNTLGAPGPVIPGSGITQTFNMNFAWQFGQSFVDDATNTIGFAGGMLIYCNGNSLTALAASSGHFGLFVDAATGAIRWQGSAAGMRVFAWIDASAPFSTAL
jgi:hypothetical protein